MDHSNNRYLAQQLHTVLKSNQTQFRGVSQGGQEGTSVAVRILNTNNSIVAIAANNHTPGEAVVFKDLSGNYFVLGEVLAYSPARTTHITYRRTKPFTPFFSKPETLLYPFKSLTYGFQPNSQGGQSIVFGIGGDAPLQLLSEPPLVSLISIGRGPNDFLKVRSENLDINTYRFSEDNLWSIDVAIPSFGNYSWIAGRYFAHRPQRFSTFTDKKTSVNDSVISGDPEDENPPYPWPRAWPLKSGWVGSFTEYYEPALLYTTTFTWNPAYDLGTLRHGAVLNTNTATSTITRGYTSQGAGAADCPITSCTEEDAGNNPLPYSGQGVGPGGRTTSTLQRNLNISGPVNTSMVAAGSKQDFTGTYIQTESESFFSQTIANPRSWTVVAHCVGTGTISFVPRVDFNISLGAISGTSEISSSIEQVKETASPYSILPGVVVQYRDREDYTRTYASTPMSVGSPSTTYTATEKGGTYVTEIEPQLYDDLGESCIYFFNDLEDSYEFSRTETLSYSTFPYISYTGTHAVPSVSVPTEDSFAYDLGVAQPGSITSTTPTRSGLSGYYKLRYPNVLPTAYYVEENGTPVEIGKYTHRSRPLTWFGPSPFEDKQIGDIVSTGSELFTTETGALIEVTLPYEGRIDDLPIPFEETYTASSHVVGRRFLVTIKRNGLITELSCIATGLGPLTNRITTTYTRELYQHIDYQILDSFTYPNPIDDQTTRITQLYGWHDWRDLVELKSERDFTTIKKSTDPGVIWDIYRIRDRPSIISNGAFVDQIVTYTKTQLLDDMTLSWVFGASEGNYFGHIMTPIQIRYNP